MREKLLNAALVVTSLIGYLEWGGGNSAFLFEAEWALLVQLVRDPASTLHPFTLFPLAGQVMLLVTLFQRPPSRWLTYLGLGGLGLLLGFMFVIGLLGMNLWTVVSCVPFLVVAAVTIRHHRGHGKTD